MKRFLSIKLQKSIISLDFPVEFYNYNINSVWGCVIQCIFMQLTKKMHFPAINKKNQVTETTPENQLINSAHLHFSFGYYEFTVST